MGFDSYNTYINNTAGFAKAEIVTPILGTGSLYMKGGGTTSGTLFPSVSISPRAYLGRGTTYGRIRTLIKPIAKGTTGYFGIHCMSSNVGDLGASFRPSALLPYYLMALDYDGTFKLKKYTAGTTLATSGSWSLGTVYALELAWQFLTGPNRVVLTGKYGTNTDFTSLTTLSATDSSSPILTSMNEGIIISTITGAGLPEATFDSVSFFISGV